MELGFTVLAVIAVQAASTATTPDSPLSENAQEQTAIETKDDALAFLPVVRIDHQRDMVVKSMLRNNTDKPIKYFTGYRFGLAWLNMELIDEHGKRIPYFLSLDWVVNEHDLRELRPGEALPINVSLGEWGKVSPGRYELRAVSSGISQYGSTPLKINRSLMLIDLTDDQENATVSAWIAVLVVAVLGLAGIRAFRRAIGKRSGYCSVKL